eukprot:g1075.t1
MFRTSSFRKKPKVPALQSNQINAFIDLYDGTSKSLGVVPLPSVLAAVRKSETDSRILKALNLRKKGVTNSQAIALARSIREYHLFREIDLRENPIERSGIVAFLKTLRYQLLSARMQSDCKACGDTVNFSLLGAGRIEKCPECGHDVSLLPSFVQCHYLTTLRLDSSDMELLDEIELYLAFLDNEQLKLLIAHLFRAEASNDGDEDDDTVTETAVINAARRLGILGRKGTSNGLDKDGFRKQVERLSSGQNTDGEEVLDLKAFSSLLLPELRKAHQLDSVEYDTPRASHDSIVVVVPSTLSSSSSSSPSDTVSIESMNSFSNLNSKDMSNVHGGDIDFNVNDDYIEEIVSVSKKGKAIKSFKKEKEIEKESKFERLEKIGKEKANHMEDCNYDDAEIVIPGEEEEGGEKEKILSIESEFKEPSPSILSSREREVSTASGISLASTYGSVAPPDTPQPPSPKSGSVKKEEKLSSNSNNKEKEVFDFRRNENGEILYDMKKRKDLNLKYERSPEEFPRESKQEGKEVGEEQKGWKTLETANDLKSLTNLNRTSEVEIQIERSSSNRSLRELASASMKSIPNFIRNRSSEEGKKKIHPNLEKFKDEEELQKFPVKAVMLQAHVFHLSLPESLIKCYQDRNDIQLNFSFTFEGCVKNVTVGSSTFPFKESSSIAAWDLPYLSVPEHCPPLSVKCECTSDKMNVNVISTFSSKIPMAPLLREWQNRNSKDFVGIDEEKTIGIARRIRLWYDEVDSDLMMEGFEPINAEIVIWFSETLNGAKFDTWSKSNAKNEFLLKNLVACSSSPPLSSSRSQHHSLYQLAVPKMSNSEKEEEELHVSLSGRQLNSLFTSGLNWQNYVTVSSLDLSHNNIERIDNRTLAMPRLEFLNSLNLSHNLISSISVEGNSFRCMPHLKKLNLSCNRITKVEGLHNCTSLEELRLSHNRIRFPQNLSLIKGLKCLYLNGNRIANTFALRSLSLSKSLRYLHLNDNPIAKHRNYRPTIIHTLPSLHTLDGRPLPESFAYQRREREETRKKEEKMKKMMKANRRTKCQSFENEKFSNSKKKLEKMNYYNIQIVIGKGSNLFRESNLHKANSYIHLRGKNGANIDYRSETIVGERNPVWYDSRIKNDQMALSSASTTLGLKVPSSSSSLKKLKFYDMPYIEVSAWDEDVMNGDGLLGRGRLHLSNFLFTSKEGKEDDAPLMKGNRTVTHFARVPLHGDVLPAVTRSISFIVRVQKSANDREKHLSSVATKNTSKKHKNKIKINDRAHFNSFGRGRDNEGGIYYKQKYHSVERERRLYKFQSTIPDQRQTHAREVFPTSYEKIEKEKEQEQDDDDTILYASVSQTHNEEDIDSCRATVGTTRSNVTSSSQPGSRVASDIENSDVDGNDDSCGTLIVRSRNKRQQRSARKQAEIMSQLAEPKYQRKKFKNTEWSEVQNAAAGIGGVGGSDNTVARLRVPIPTPKPSKHEDRDKKSNPSNTIVVGSPRLGFGSTFYPSLANIPPKQRKSKLKSNVKISKKKNSRHSKSPVPRPPLVTKRNSNLHLNRKENSPNLSKKSIPKSPLSIEALDETIDAIYNGTAAPDLVSETIKKMYNWQIETSRIMEQQRADLERYRKNLEFEEETDHDGNIQHASSVGSSTPSVSSLLTHTSSGIVGRKVENELKRNRRMNWNEKNQIQTLSLSKQLRNRRMNQFNVGTGSISATSSTTTTSISPKSRNVQSSGYDPPNIYENTSTSNPSLSHLFGSRKTVPSKQNHNFHKSENFDVQNIQRHVPKAKRRLMDTSYLASIDERREEDSFSGNLEKHELKNIQLKNRKRRTGTEYENSFILNGRVQQWLNDVREEEETAITALRLLFSLAETIGSHGDDEENSEHCKDAVASYRESMADFSMFVSIDPPRSVVEAISNDEAALQSIMHQTTELANMKSAIRDLLQLLERDTSLSHNSSKLRNHLISILQSDYGHRLGVLEANGLLPSWLREVNSSSEEILRDTPDSSKWRSLDVATSIVPTTRFKDDASVTSSKWSVDVASSVKSAGEGCGDEQYKQDYGSDVQKGPSSVTSSTSSATDREIMGSGERRVLQMEKMEELKQLEMNHGELVNELAHSLHEVDDLKSGLSHDHQASKEENLVKVLLTTERLQQEMTELTERQEELRDLTKEGNSGDTTGRREGGEENVGSDGGDISPPDGDNFQKLGIFDKLENVETTSSLLPLISVDVGVGVRQHFNSVVENGENDNDRNDSNLNSNRSMVERYKRRLQEKAYELRTKSIHKVLVNEKSKENKRNPSLLSPLSPLTNPSLQDDEMKNDIVDQGGSTKDNEVYLSDDDFEEDESTNDNASQISNSSVMEEEEEDAKRRRTNENVILPPGWSSAVSRTNGHRYYIELSTGRTTYEIPKTASEIQNSKSVED